MPTVPCPVDPSGGGNVAAEMQAWIDSLAQGDVGDLGGLSYRCDQTLVFANRTNVGLANGEIWTDDPTGDASTLETPSKAARNRAHIRITQSSNITMTDVSVRGANALGGTDDSAQVTALEAQHGFDLLGASDVTIAGGEVSYVYGDLVYVGGHNEGPCYRVTVTSSDNGVFHGHHVGRQGIAVCNGYDTLIENFDIHDIRRSLLDFETALQSWHAERIEVRNGTFGAKALSFIAAKGKQHVHDIYVHDVTVNAPANIVCEPPEPAARRRNWRFENVTSTGTYGSSVQKGAWTFLWVDGLTVKNNTVKLQAGRDMYLVTAFECTAVDVSGNTYADGVGELRGTSIEEEPPPVSTPPELPVAGGAVNSWATELAAWFSWAETQIASIDAGGATGGPSSHYIDINPFMTPTSHVNWNNAVAAASYLMGGYNQSLAFQNDEISWDVGIDAGTWTIELLYATNTDAGVFHVLIDGVEVGQVDSYSSTLVRNVKAPITGVAVATAGIKQVTLRMASKNAASSSYKAYLQWVSLRRTGE